jgi:L-2-hydroxyglutarate oxidase LhgO
VKTPLNKTNVLIIGAGVVGLSVAAELCERLGARADVALLEGYDTFGQETSGRNSEVIHAGIYYPAASLKAVLCVEGKELIYSFCKQWNVAHQRVGKIIVATKQEEIGKLESLLEQARQNGVGDLVMLDRKELARLEPNVRAEAGLLSPSTGIMDSHGIMARLEQLALQKGVFIAYRHRVTGIECLSDGFKVFFTNPDGSPDYMCCEWLVNSAGLGASLVAQWAGIDPQEAGYKIFPCKGEYFSIRYGKGKLVSRLIYPTNLEELKGLGVHLTKALDGRLRLGPNACYVDELDYGVNPEHGLEFYEAAKPFLPFLEEEDLTPEMAGIRPKLQGPEDSFRDFVIEHETGRGLEGLINLIGIESPGLTCCLSIARKVAGMITG